jgi:hypothetical protein
MADTGPVEKGHDGGHEHRVVGPHDLPHRVFPSAALEHFPIRLIQLVSLPVKPGNDREL